MEIDALFDADSQESELIGVAEVAKLAGVSRAAVVNWRNRGTSGFPPPATENRSGPLYRTSDIQEWLERRPGKKTAKEAPRIEAQLWAAADKLRGGIDASQYRNVVLGLIFLHRVASGASRGSVVVPESVDWDADIVAGREGQLAARVTAAVQRVEVANPAIAGSLSGALAAVNIDERRLLGLMEVVGKTLSSVPPDSENDVMGRIYEYFLGRFAALEGKSGGEFFTPSSVVRLLVEMIEPLDGTVYDPCCGSGGMFVQSARFRDEHRGQRSDLRIFGQESNPSTWGLARMNLALHDLSFDLGPGPADTFHDDQHPKLRADYILANPPFNISDWGVEDLHNDERWSYGLPPAGNANLAWVQHIVYHLSDRGRAGVVLSNGALTTDNPGEFEIRRRLIDDDLVECMVALPAQLFYSTTIPVTLWLLAKDKHASIDRRGQVLFIDAKDFGEKVTRSHRDLRRSEVSRIVEEYRSWRADAGYTGSPGFARAVALDEIRRNDYSLAPSRYVGSKRVEGDAGATLEDLAVEFEQVAAMVSMLDAGIQGALKVELS